MPILRRTPAPPPADWLAKLRRDPASRAVLKSWRLLAGGQADAERRTLLACSGGTDSAALVLALGCQATGVRSAIVVAHIRHDLRPARDARADLLKARELAELVGIRFVSASVRVRKLDGNAEANARHARYDALARLAKRAGCSCIATAHHADDQLETVLMRLMRGTGPRGMAAIHPVRRLSARSPIKLVRPMLEIDRADAERLTGAVPGWAPAVDASNFDTTRLRSRLRIEVVPLLKAISPSVAKRVSANTRWFRDPSHRTG